MSQNKIWFQKLFYKESVLAIKSSLDFLNFESFKNDLVLLLPQESRNSRVRIANNIIKRFFPDRKLFGFLPQVYQAYKNESLLQELLRYEFLSKEPVISNFYLQNIHAQIPGKEISSTKFASYIEKTYGSRNENLTWWLQAALRDLGFISKSGNVWIINKIKLPETALILLLHNTFATFPTSLKLSLLEKDNFWKLIGIKDVEELKNILFKAHLYNIIEFKDNNITTQYPVEVLINKKFRIDSDQ